MNAPLTDIEEILFRATERARARALPYAGEVTPTEAYRLATNHGARIIEVRSIFEYAQIGRVPHSSLISWKHWPSGELNPQFLPKLARTIGFDSVVLFLCRSGVRSHAAAESSARAGYKFAFNILQGFEGDLNGAGQRGHVGGWRKAGLPWVQD